MPKALITTVLLLAFQQPLPPNYTTILENQTFRIIRVHYGPHESVPVHDHPDIPTVFVYLNNSGPVRIIHEEKDGTQSTIVRPPTHTGAFRVSPGMLERHSIENPGDLPSDFLRVELIGLRLGDNALALPSPDFRGPAPADLTHNLTTTEFSSPRLTVARTICADPQPCGIAPSSGPSVIITISESAVTTDGKKTTLAQGKVMAIGPNQSIQISQSTSVVAHVLQVIVQAPPPAR